ncbi:MAG: gliding motility-associated C-terminal domain-containing protein [Bacteroidota bacterium]
MIKLKRLLFIVVLFFSVNTAFCQITMTNNNATFYCAAGSIVWVHGGVDNIGDSLYNLGHITICGDLQNNGLISGNGIYEVAGHWVNNNTFKHGTSEVIMNNKPYGIITPVVTDQIITGSNITSFYDLTLTGVGIKSTTLDDTATHSLNLNDRELAIDNHHFWVTNPDPLAITRTLGFVSNLTDGWLYRIANVNGPYLFPMGNNGVLVGGPYRYRPVEIKPSVSDSDIYRVGFFNYNPNIDGDSVKYHDTTICMVDSLYYHRIDREYGTNPVDLTIYYEEQTDGPWNGMANWNQPQPGMWNNMAPTTMIYSPMEGVIKSNWNTWTNDPYALIAKVPDSVGISGPLYACIGAGPFTYEAWGDPLDEYIWTVTGGTIVGDPTGYIIQIEWDTPGIGVINMQEITHWGYCTSLMSSYYTLVYPEPIAGFQVMQSDTSQLFSYDLTHFVDTSILAAQWYWDFGDGMTSTQESPYHVYDKPGIYTVCLSIVSPDNCTDSACTTIEVEEGMIVPNVFTPNGDGFNDDYYIRCSGMSNFYLQIYNRWGVLMFESGSPSVRWDGKTLSGELASEGTYYYILNANSESTDYSQHGFLSLLR